MEYISLVENRKKTIFLTNWYNPLSQANHESRESRITFQMSDLFC